MPSPQHAAPRTFFLGAHQPHWLGLVDFPLFVSHQRLYRRRTLPRAVTTWACDSAAFTQISMYGSWQTTPWDYAAAVARYAEEIGQMAWAAPQDVMCEPFILAKTGMTVRQHQDLTVGSFLDLKSIAPTLPFIPVLQGWEPQDYEFCASLYAAHGIDLTAYPVVGLGSVCRRQGTAEIGAVVQTLSGHGIRLHGFGVKTLGLARYGGLLHSSDSMSWSVAGRRQPGCAPGHRSESNCLTYATAWRRRLLENTAPSAGASDA